MFRDNEDVVENETCEDGEYGINDGLEYMYNNHFWKAVFLTT